MRGRLEPGHPAELHPASWPLVDSRLAVSTVVRGGLASTAPQRSTHRCLTDIEDCGSASYVARSAASTDARSAESLQCELAGSISQETGYFHMKQPLEEFM